ncbi:MAG: DUF4956 domain-containing protein [Gemmatimonadetes bacterium]|nr:DUF4956 domain-containing protein [Gemmatimonadota bacterium]MXY82405.1 DUF4956 domain-containing protein [Gemmatimonadota bacterium]MYB68903.1 DUF4956 domain-containing protein [Gemmatimonadota bacterium]
MLNNMIIRLIVYYAAWLLALSGIFYLFPQILYYVAQERKRIFVAKSLEFGADTAPFPLGNIEEGVARLIDPAHTIPVMVALVLAFGVTLPVTWVYRWTRPRKKYSQSFAHTLLVIPTSITLVVFLVKGSLALAFSLAGIVAAVRFRTSLEEPMDAVYMFMAIGIGLAAGTQLTTVAYLASLVFVAIALGVWKSNFGARPAVISGWTIVYPDKSAQVSEAGDTATATQKPCDAQIEVHATNVEEVQKATDLILNSNTKRWQVADVVNNEDGTVVVLFDVWLKKSVNPLSLIRDIEESGKGYINEVRMRGNNS